MCDDFDSELLTLVRRCDNTVSISPLKFEKIEENMLEITVENTQLQETYSHEHSSIFHLKLMVNVKQRV